MELLPSWATFSITLRKIVVEVHRAFGLPQVYKLWMGASKDMLPVKHLSSKDPHGAEILWATKILRIGVDGICLP